jgi:hypothetical protein
LINRCLSTRFINIGYYYLRPFLGKANSGSPANPRSRPGDDSNFSG